MHLFSVHVSLQPVLQALAVIAATLLVGVVPVGTSAEQIAPGLPARLTADEFWQLSVELSEPDAEFISDNLVSNEMSFAQVVPQLKAVVAPGGVYIGVGPEQNFTYLAALRSRFAFIVDLRRGNLLLHLMYKALFDLSPDRRTFLSRLFARTPPRLATTATVAALMEAFEAAPPLSEEGQRRNVEDLRRVLRERYRVPLTDQDFTAIEEAYAAFRRFGPGLGYATRQVGRPFGHATYANLMLQRDEKGEPLSYLASEQSYRFVRDLQQRNAIVPVVGNFAGPKALRAIGSYLRARGAIVGVFYLSNVEDYLGLARVPKNGEWPIFCANAASLPRDDQSVFVRPLGLAVHGADGSITFRRDMQIGDRPSDATTMLPDQQPQFPPALTRIADDVKACGV